MSRPISILALGAAVLLAGWLVYMPGLSGGFLFDDHPNLSPLGDYGAVDDLDNLYSYLQSGDSGPTGRPLSLLTFLIDGRTWPTDPRNFKRTNILIHLLVGVLAFAAVLRLLPQIGYRRSDAVLIAVVAAALWLLHPYLVSTTLYVIQRMAQLAALFTLAAIVGYLHGRSLLASRPRSGLLWMTVSVVMGTGLAVLSKENGALTPTLILVIEWTLARHWVGPGPALWWRVLFLWMPTLAVLAYLGKRLTGSGQLPARPYTLDERLMTQPRILWEYLQHLLLPRMQTRGLYQDGYNFSTGWLSPWTTLPALLGLVALAALAVFARRRFPLVALAILFFLAGHLIESTTIGLELYFEHRNYLPAVFLFLPIAAGLVWLRGRVRTGIWAALLLTPMLLLGALTHQRASLWGDTPLLLSVWAQGSPESPRAQNSIAQNLYDEGRLVEALLHLQEVSDRMPHSALLSVRLLIHQVDAGVATPRDFERAIERAQTQAFDAQAIGALTVLVDVLGRPPVPEYAAGAHALLDAFHDNPGFQRFGLVRRNVPYLHMRLHLAQGNIGEAVEYARVGMRRHADIDTALAIVAQVASAGFAQHALDLMEQAKEIFATQDVGTLKRTRSVYEQEIEYLTQVLIEDSEATQDP